MVKREMVKGTANSLLLSLLEEKPMYGYQIVKEIEARSQGYFMFKEGTLYPALYRLEKAGMVTGEWQLLPNGRCTGFLLARSRMLAVTVITGTF